MDDLWEVLYAAEFDLRYATAHKRSGLVTNYTDGDIEVFREKRDAARRAVLDMAGGGPR